MIMIMIIIVVISPPRAELEAAQLDHVALGGVRPYLFGSFQDIYIYIYMSIHVYIYIYTHTHTYMRICVCMYIYIYIYTHAAQYYHQLGLVRLALMIVYSCSSSLLLALCMFMFLLDNNGNLQTIMIINKNTLKIMTANENGWWETPNSHKTSLIKPSFGISPTYLCALWRACEGASPAPEGPLFKLGES